MSSEQKSVIGIDIGSAFLSVVQINLNGEILNHVYLEHNGRIRELLNSLDSKFDLSSVCAITTPSGKEWFDDKKSGNKELVHYYDHQTALIQAAEKYIKDDFGSILQVGAGRFQLIMFDEIQVQLEAGGDTFKDCGYRRAVAFARCEKAQCPHKISKNPCTRLILLETDCRV